MVSVELFMNAYFILTYFPSYSQSGYYFTSSDCVQCPPNQGSLSRNTASSCTINCAPNEATCTFSADGTSDTPLTWFVFSFRLHLFIYTDTIFFHSHDGYTITDSSCVVNAVVASAPSSPSGLPCDAGVSTCNDDSTGEDGTTIATGW